MFDSRQLQLLWLASFNIRNDAAVRLTWAILELVEGQTAVLRSHMVDFLSLLSCCDPWRDLKIKSGTEIAAQKGLIGFIILLNIVEFLAYPRLVNSRTSRDFRCCFFKGINIKVDITKVMCGRNGCLRQGIFALLSSLQELLCIQPWQDLGLAAPAYRSPALSWGNAFTCGWELHPERFKLYFKYIHFSHVIWKCLKLKVTLKAIFEFCSSSLHAPQNISLP